MELEGKKIILGLTGSIAAYKAVYLLRLLVKAGADVQVVMTPTAREFVGVVTFSALSGKPVLVDFFASEGGEWNSHVELGTQADLMIVAPVTAASLGKMAGGIADNLLVTTYLSARCPVLFAPAMDLDMYAHPSTQRSIEILRGYGMHFIEPESGELASGLEGKGRMAEPESILEHALKLLPGASKKKLLNRRVLITAGPTHENIDPVRFIGNHSTGKMGYAIAVAFEKAGAEVVLVSGPVPLPDPPGKIEVQRVESAAEMYEACEERIETVDIAIFNAAVSDYTPVDTLREKVKREKSDWEIRLKPTRDIAASMGRHKKSGQIMVGFALETSEGLKHAREKLGKKNMDLIVLNSLEDSGAGFATDTNKVSMLDSSGGVEHYPLKSKEGVADDLVERVIKLMEDA